MSQSNKDARWISREPGIPKATDSILQLDIGSKIIEESSSYHKNESCSNQGYGNVLRETHELSNFQTIKDTTCNISATNIAFQSLTSRLNLDSIQTGLILRHVLLNSFLTSFYHNTRSTMQISPAHNNPIPLGINDVHAIAFNDV
ncbi:hypothetical protein WN51_12913 [Melipona quadrifasciata]|uniref:Uncharacterized protein n=1 Tax=Melipona quadrifasciata TaxID=166423 RepID=A0A0M9AAB3_9HYME|nr:hypothetical protein WN51_12913 [Melipona quadrifasciata]